MKQLVALYVLIFATSLVSIVSEAVSQPLSQISNLHWISLDVETQSFSIDALLPEGVYEARVSWPATVPSSIHLWLATLDTGCGKMQSRSRRKLLDTQKLVFELSATSQEKIVCMHAKRRSRHRDGPLGGAQRLPFHIVLEPVIHGIPRSAWSVALTCFLIVAVVAFLTPYWIRGVVPWLMAFANLDATIHSFERAD